MFAGTKPLSPDALKFAVDSFKKIKDAEEVAKLRHLSFNSSTSLSCKFPPHTDKTPEMEFGRYRFDKNLWAIHAHGKCVCTFTEELMDGLKNTQFG